MGDDFLSEKDGLSKSLRKYLRIGILVAVFLICVFLIYFSVSYEPQIEYVCGDGTNYGSCSNNRPYFCEENVLIELSSQCGCPPELEPFENKCRSQIYSGENLSQLNYINGGNKNYLEFVVHEGIYEYFSKLPRYLTYEEDEEPIRADFKSMKINEENQREALLPLVVSIQNLAPWSKEEQAQIAVSLVQNIPYGEPNPVSIFMGFGESRISRYPYQTIYEYKGSCEGKSELLAFLLKELGFEVVLFYFQEENHEAVGVKCPVEYSLNGTGYCFIETTLAGPISYSEGRYLGPGGNKKLGSYSEIIKISEGFSLGGIEDYQDAKNLKKLVDKVDEKGYVNYFEKKKLDELREKYGLIY